MLKENYLRLLIAIECSTNNEKENVYGVYDIKSNECVIMIVENLDDVAKIFKTSGNSIRSMFSRHQLIRDRFEIVKFKQEEDSIEELLDLTDEDSLENMLLM